MTAYPRISIVTPSFNQGQYLEKNILSIISQGYPEVEHIIIDGGSTDNTIEIIKKYERHISYWISESDKGQSDALNKGLSKCTGDIFNWINSDDYLEDNSLFNIANCFINNPSFNVVCGWCRMFEADSLGETFKHRTEIFKTLEDTLVEQRINQPATFYKLDVVKKLGGINSSLQYVMDLDLWFRYLASQGQQHVLLTDDLLAHFRLHGQSKTMQFQQKFREEEKLLWYHLLKQVGIGYPLISFFESSENYYQKVEWNTRVIDKKQLIDCLCKKYLIAFYTAKNLNAARFAFRNQLKAGKIRFQRRYAGIFYNLFLKRWK